MISRKDVSKVKAAATAAYNSRSQLNMQLLIQTNIRLRRRSREEPVEAARLFSLLENANRGTKYSIVNFNKNSFREVHLVVEVYIQIQCE